MIAAEDRVATFLDGVRRRRGAVISPEGVPLAVELADFAERAIAFLLDLVFIQCGGLVLLLLVFGCCLALNLVDGFSIKSPLALTFILFTDFALRNLYFIHFELAWQGATPGKRIVGLRAIDRRGGPLEPGSVIARNLTRHIEMFLPLGLLLSLGKAGGAVWEQLALAAWFLAFTALPFFNRDRMRAGDLIAGTIVIALPRRALLADLAEPRADYAFTEAQLDAYGAFELQILEELLRGADARRLRRDVCARICRKIAWPAPVPDAETDRFLRDFYAAQRAHLERAQLYGRQRPDKDHRPEG
jgi:uncharacterized RDD family membrane protein YckC